MQIGTEEQDVVAQYDELVAQQEELTKQVDFMSGLLSDVKSTSEKYEAELNAKREKALAEFEQTQAAVTKLKETLEVTTLDLTEQVEQGWANRLAVDDEFAKFCEANKSYATGLDLKARARMLSSDIAEIKRIYREQQIDAKRQAVAERIAEVEKQLSNLHHAPDIEEVEAMRKKLAILTGTANKLGLRRGSKIQQRLARVWDAFDELKADAPIVTKPKNKMAKAMEEANNATKMRKETKQ